MHLVPRLAFPRCSYWTATLITGRICSERSLDWGNDLVATGDVRRIHALFLHCPDGRTATLDVSPNTPAFQFKTRTLDLLGAQTLDYQVIGRVVDRASGRCECFAWDYHPEPGVAHLVAYKSSIYSFGAWRTSMLPIGALSLDVQGFRL